LTLIHHPSDRLLRSFRRTSTGLSALEFLEKPTTLLELEDIKAEQVTQDTGGEQLHKGSFGNALPRGDLGLFPGS
jgi:hypothetical protein